MKAPPIDGYSTQVIKGGAMVQETFVFIQRWDPTQSPEKNLDQLLARRALGKPTLKRERDALSVLRRRFVEPEAGERVRRLRRVYDRGIQREPLLQILLYYTMDADPLVRHFCTDYLYGLWHDGASTVTTNALTQHLVKLSAQDGQDEGWSPRTARRVAQGLLSLARDFGLLYGVNPKKLASPRLAFAAFIYIAYDLHDHGVPDKPVLEADIWRAYLKDPKQVEDFFVRAQQEGLLYYNRAGSTVRIDWKLSNHDEVVEALVA